MSGRLRSPALAAAVYGSVLFVAAPGRPPPAFAEVRVTVKGDITAAALVWANWARP